MLVHLKEIVRKAQAEGYGLGAFNTSNLEVTKAIIEAALAKNSPIIIQVSEATINYVGLLPVTNLIKTFAQNSGAKIPVVIHLDHGKNFQIIKACLKAGFRSVHIDASDKPLAQNVAMTKKIVNYAHHFGAWVQGELGSLYGKEGLAKIKLPKNPNDYLTDPKKVKVYVAKTKIDTLAVSVGTMHGFYVGKEKIDLNRVRAIAQETKIPLVLHGSSGVNPAILKKAISAGIRIVNIDTALRITFTKTLRKTVSQVKEFYDPRKILAPSMAAVQKTVEEQLAILGSAHKI